LAVSKLLFGERRALGITALLRALPDSRPSTG